MELSDATWTTTTFCRKCKKLRGCLDTHSVSGYRYLCKECAAEEQLVSACRSCGREGILKLLNKQGGYCWKCYGDNIQECSLCGAEEYSHKVDDGVCNKCSTGKNRPCIKCGSYMNANKLSSDGLCDKCSVVIYKTLKDSKVNEVVECLECGRECYVNDLSDGLCIYCYSEGLEAEISRLKKRINKKKKSYNC